MGYTITVEATKDLRIANGAIGQADFDHLNILLQEHSVLFPRLRTSIEHTYIHELVHWLFYLSGKKDLNDDEVFVDVFAGLLHQVLTTSKGALKIASIS